MESDLVAVSAEASRLVGALEMAWKSIQGSHPGVPDAVIVLGTGVERGRLAKLGHWWGGQWVADGTPRGEVLLAGEALHLKPTDVFEVLLHEAAHGLNTARGVKDVSRGGRYHNAKYKATAIEVGLQVGSMPPYGWAKTELSPKAVEHYADDIARISEEMRIARRMARGNTIEGVIGGEGTTAGNDTSSPGEPDATKKSKPAECGCGRKMRMAPSVMAKGPVTCGVCNTTFELDRVVAVQPEQEAPGAGRLGETKSGEVIESFVGRRSEQLGKSTEPESRSEHPSSPRPGPRPSSVQSELVDELRSRLRTPLDAERLLAVSAWRGQPGADPEGPMVAADWNEHARLTQLARTVMGIEGSLTVPDGIDQRSPILVGEWVKTAVIIEPRLIDSLPAPDTPGRVVDIDGTTLRVTVDFATWGETELSLGDAYRALRWDYATVDPTLRLTRSGPALDPYAPGGEPTAGAGSELEIDL